jgi:hypothetical protein
MKTVKNMIGVIGIKNIDKKKTINITVELESIFK